MSLLRDKLKIEWVKNGKWYGVSSDEMLAPDVFDDAIQHLSETPERYYYPTIGKRIRISFYEP